jgi:hypothetical protein
MFGVLTPDDVVIRHYFLWYDLMRDLSLPRQDQDEEASTLPDGVTDPIAIEQAESVKRLAAY